MSENRIQLDLDSHIKKMRDGPCWICSVIQQQADYPPQHIIDENDQAIAFLNPYPSVRGMTIVAPKDHREHVVGNFSEGEYISLQRFIWRVGRAVNQVAQSERTYVASLGSQQVIAHVHWHIVPVPPNLPFEEQESALLDLKNGYLDLSDVEMRTLAADIRMMLMMV